jgi:8-oxo-dGTP pyrophosphatase MutT (NUDIX family)
MYRTDSSVATAYVEGSLGRLCPLVDGAVKTVRQAGAIAVRPGPEPLFLLVTSRRTPSAWIFPKGHIEPGERVVDAALRELEEEAGVTGRPLRTLDALKFRSGDEDVEVQYVLVKASNEGDRREGRSLCWLPLDEALAALRYEDSRSLLRTAAKLVARLT